MSNYRIDYGKTGEDRAADFLAERDYTILARNFRNGRYGEIDLIARKGNLLLFVEVKSRRHDEFGGPLYSIGAGKKKKIRSTAQRFIQSNPHLDRRDITFRFDLIAVSEEAIEWHEDVFR